jgi:hypothetical protein
MTENSTLSRRDDSEPPGFYKVRETAQYLRLCEKQVRRLIWL